MTHPPYKSDASAFPPPPAPADYLGPDARDAVALGRWALGAGRPRVFPTTGGAS